MALQGTECPSKKPEYTSNKGGEPAVRLQVPVRGPSGCLDIVVPARSALFLSKKGTALMKMESGQWLSSPEWPQKE